VRPAPDFAETGIVYAFTSRRLVISTDWARTFSEIAVPADAELHDVSPGENQTLFAAVRGQGSDIADDLYTSTDRGSTWELVDNPVLSGGLESIRASGVHVLATLHSGGIACSADGGASWATRCPAA
jgi:hypothetical protein